MNRGPKAQSLQRALPRPGGPPAQGRTTPGPRVTATYCKHGTAPSLPLPAAASGLGAAAAGERPGRKRRRRERRSSAEQHAPPDQQAKQQLLSSQEGADHHPLRRDQAEAEKLCLLEGEGEFGGGLWSKL